MNAKRGLKTSGLVNTKRSAPKLGDFLIAADIISEQDLLTAIQTANKSQQPLERVLIDLQLVSAGTMENVAALRVLVLDGELNGATAIKALGRCHRQRFSVEDSLRELGWKPREPKEYNELGLLLLDSEVIAQTVYEDALASIKEQSVTLGEFLVLRRGLSHNLINGALQSITMIASDKLSRRDATLILKKISAGRSFWDALTEVGLDSRTVCYGRLSLGEVLTQGGFISEAERIAAVERALEQKQMLGELLVQSGVITSVTLQSALQIQELARSGVLSETEAFELLKASERTNLSIEEAIQNHFSEAEHEKASRSIELLIQAGILCQNDLARAAEKGQRFGLDALRGLVLAGVIDRTVFEAVRELVVAVARGEYSPDECILFLNYVERSRCNLSEAIENVKSPALQPAQEAAILATSGKFAVISEPSKHTAVTVAEPSSVEQVVGRALTPLLFNRLLRSLTILAVSFGALLLFCRQLEPIHLAILFSSLLVIETIRNILDVATARKELVETRKSNIEDVQGRAKMLKEKARTKHSLAKDNLAQQQRAKVESIR
jgi:hypothetical protein